MDTSELHITNIPREQKGLWVVAAKINGGKLDAWAIEALNAAAQHTIVNAPPQPWARALSERTATCLTRHGFFNKKGVREAFENPAFDWKTISNFGPSCLQEVLKWLEK